MLTKRQLVCLWLGIAVFVLLALVPPWQQAYGVRVVRPLWHAPLFSPPKPEGGLSVRVDGVRLMLEWSIAAAITAGLLLTFRKSGLIDPDRTVLNKARKQEVLGPIAGTLLGETIQKLLAGELPVEEVRALYSDPKLTKTLEAAKSLRKELDNLGQ